MLRVIAFWLDRGVDGLRCDAVPYLFEREGTTGENLPETHAFITRVRRFVDERYGDRLLMPRMFMGIRREDRHPIVEILRRTPRIPEGCQWALFLRNHDELTLEMVTDEERDYLYREYAGDPRARLNLGIRRRLAPLLDGSRRRIELLNSLLVSLPGTPIIYYGDEIGMGDNIYLGDRKGVRTPMQWSGDRNAGFSRCDPDQLYLPPIENPLYHYAAINVDAQERRPASLLNWMKWRTA